MVNVNFAERGLHKIKVAGVWLTLGGGAAGNLVTVGPNSRIYPTAKRPRLAVVSDSYYEVTGNVTTLTTATELGHQLGMNVFNVAQGGSGYMNPSGGGANGQKQFGGDAVFAALARFPKADMLLVNGTANDLGYTDGQVTAAMQAFFQRVRTEYDADIPIITCGIEPVNSFRLLYPDPAMTNRDTLQYNTAVADANVVAALRPAVRQWIYGTGNVTAPAGNGNQDFVCGPDGTHPTDYGQMYYGRLVAESIKSALTAL